MFSFCWSSLLEDKRKSRTSIICFVEGLGDLLKDFGGRIADQSSNGRLLGL